jgi:hypothetical protein
MKIVKPLTRRQKRAAMLIAGGMKYTKVCKIIGINRDQLRGWRKLPKFETRLKRLSFEYDQYIDTKQKQMIDHAFKSLERMLDSSRWQAVAFAVEAILKINKKYPEAVGKFQHNVSGEVVQNHQGSVIVNTKQLKPEQKEKIKELLHETRNLTSQN